MLHRAGVVMAAGIALMLVMNWSPAAQADWAYTRWGMTADQVVAASSGTVKPLPVAQRTRNEADRWEITVQGTHRDGALTHEVGFMFDTQSGGLKCVLYNSTGTDVAVLRSELLKRYGKPAQDGTFGRAQTLTWDKPDDIELVAMQSPLAATVTHCAPANR